MPLRLLRPASLVTQHRSPLARQSADMCTEQLHGHEAELNLKLQATFQNSHSFKVSRWSGLLIGPICPQIAGNALCPGLPWGRARQGLQQAHARQKRGMRTFVLQGKDQGKEARDDHPGLSKHDAHCLQQCEVGQPRDQVDNHWSGYGPVPVTQHQEPVQTSIPWSGFTDAGATSQSAQHRACGSILVSLKVRVISAWSSGYGNDHQASKVRTAPQHSDAQQMLGPMFGRG